MTRTTEVAVLIRSYSGIRVLFACTTSASRNSADPRPIQRIHQGSRDLARASGPAVVQISVRGRAALSEGDVRQTGFVADRRATGSGVIVDPDGYIVTDAHIVIDARHIDVSVIDGAQSGQPAKHKHFPATTVGLDRETDLAVLKIEARGLRNPGTVQRTAPGKELTHRQPFRPESLRNCWRGGPISARPNRISEAHPRGSA